MKLNVITSGPFFGVNAQKKIILQTLEIRAQSDRNKMITINPPYPIDEKSALKIRLLSAELREGMVIGLNQ